MQVFLNPNARRTPYDDELQQILNLAAGRESRARLSTWSRLVDGPTPAWELRGLAVALGLASITMKDESQRSDLASFKVLGAPNALIQLIQRHWPEAQWSAEELFAGRQAADLRDFVVVSATDGNHGRALAAAAQSVGCRCVIVLHAKVHPERAAAISALGAEILRVDGNYDDSVAEAARLAAANGWHVVSDTSYEGYETVPRDVMQGYGVLADELLQDIVTGGPCPYTHVVLQGGVGGLAAGVISHFWERYGSDRPTFIVVEPHAADCLYQSALKGQPARAVGNVDSVMAGLACGEASPLAWRFLQPSVDLFMTIGDAAAESAMRTLAYGAHGDVPIVSGESGAAGLAGLIGLCVVNEWRALAGLDGESRVLLINSEGATAPGLFEQIVGRPHTAIAADQAHALY